MGNLFSGAHIPANIADYQFVYDSGQPNMSVSLMSNLLQDMPLEQPKVVSVSDPRTSLPALEIHNIWGQ